MWLLLLLLRLKSIAKTTTITTTKGTCVLPYGKNSFNPHFAGLIYIVQG